MSVVNIVKRPFFTREEFDAFVARGGRVTVLKSKRRLPKSLRYTPSTVTCGNDAPTFNPMRHSA